MPHDLSGLLKLHPACRHQTVRVGTERAPVLVVDQFLSDPRVLIEFAASQCRFSGASETFYPGIRAPMPPIYSFAVRAFLGSAISAAFGLGQRQVARELAHFCLVTTPPQTLQPLQRLPHFDSPDDLQLAVLHYLSPVDQGGTSFYRHRSTGFESLSNERSARYAAALDADVRAQGPSPTAYINGDSPMFERIASFAGEFNRVLVYRSVSLHSADIASDFRFEADPRRGRLTANLFYFYR